MFHLFFAFAGVQTLRVHGVSSQRIRKIALFGYFAELLELLCSQH